MPFFIFSLCDVICKAEFHSCLEISILGTSERRTPTKQILRILFFLIFEMTGHNIFPCFPMIWDSVQFSRSVVSNSLWPHESQHTRPPYPSPTPWVHSDSRPSSRWCHPAISSPFPVVPFSSCPQSLPASVFSNESILHMRWPKYWSFSFSIIPSKEHPGLISFRMDWLALLVVQGTLKSLLQHYSSKASILWRSAFFTVQLSHPYITTGKTIALTRWTFVGKVMSLLFNMIRDYKYNNVLSPKLFLKQKKTIIYTCLREKSRQVEGKKICLN